MATSNPITLKISPAARLATLAIGWVVLAYAFVLTFEVLGRKFFTSSFKGVDELGGFVLAIAAAIGASYALVQRSHTRVDVFLVRFSRPVQRWLNALAQLTFALFATFAAWRSVAVLLETIEYKSSATNLEQPLWVPQLAWVVGLCLLALISLVYAVHAAYLLARKRPELNAWYGPISAQEELEAELLELKSRGTSSETVGVAAVAKGR